MRDDGEWVGDGVAGAGEPDWGDCEGTAGHHRGYGVAVGALFRDIGADVDELAGEVRTGDSGRYVAGTD
ncbi:MAG: hypothetical protein WAV89_03720 [Ignavibacteriaceae bacterium]